MSPTPEDRIAAIVRDAPLVAGPGVPPRPSAVTTRPGDVGPHPDDIADEGWPEDDLPPQPSEDDEASPTLADAGDADVTALCSTLEQNDTDNGARLKAHFGPDVLHGRDIGWHVWRGTHFELPGGDEAIVRIAQRTAKRIVHETRFLVHSPASERAIRAGEEATARIEAGRRATPAIKTFKPDPYDLQAIEDGKAALAFLAAQKAGRRKFGISSGNAARIAAMISQALPHLTVPQDDLDSDPLALNCLNGTLRFRRVEDSECPDPDAVRFTVSAELRPHDRADRITKVAPVRYDPEAECPRWLAFLERFQPNAHVRRFLQAYNGYALTALTGEQSVVLNIGGGANGKSTYIEGISRLMGPYAGVLNAESLSGQGQRRGDQATPDFARLSGVRLLRVSELPRGEPLKEALVKALTGGEPMLVRHLNKGFFELTPVFKASMSGNDFPTIGGGDHGIWRRMRLVPWRVTIPLEEQRPMGEIMAEFEAERSGILNWLIEGLGIYFAEGLPVPDEIADATQAYREEMDPLAGFVADCVERAPGHHETARAMYEAFVSWCEANAKRPWKETAFGRAMPSKGFPKTTERIRRYLDVRLHDVPPRPEGAPRSPYEGGE